VFGELGYGLTFGAIAAEPFAGLAWVHLDTTSFTETGGVSALAGSGNREDVGYSTLGAVRRTRSVPAEETRRGLQARFRRQAHGWQGYPRASPSASRLPTMLW
jgi:uncharacterized protein with beta-barrel porin domain